MEFDGFMNYQIKVKAAENTSVDDIALLTSSAGQQRPNIVWEWVMKADCARKATNGNGMWNGIRKVSGLAM